MKIAEINMTHYGSTGNIMFAIAEEAKKRGIEISTYSANCFSIRNRRKASDVNHKYFGYYLDQLLHQIIGRTVGYNGCFSWISTAKLIRHLKKEGVSVVHLHNLHNYCFNFPLFFKYIRKNDIQVVWTLHDCWSFTGHCPHFDMISCNKWKTKCGNCSAHNSYPKSLMDDSSHMFELKKKWFLGVHRLTIVTPSRWLADCVKMSFLKEYPIVVINNGIDLNTFHPVESNFRIKYNCQEKKVLLGVAAGWNKRKGIDVFTTLADILGHEYQIVLVGTNENVDKHLPSNIISIHRTDNKKELAAIYSAADVFVNPTKEDTFPTVNIEALACGTPVITYRTGGSPEIIDETCGVVVEKNDISNLKEEICRVCTDKPFDSDLCVKRAKLFDMNDRFKEYIGLYEDLIYRSNPFKE